MRFIKFYKRYYKLLRFTGCNIVSLLKFIKNKPLRVMFYTVFNLSHLNACLYVNLKNNLLQPVIYKCVL